MTRIELSMPRVAVNAMEPRAALGDYSASDGRYTLYAGNQMPHDMRHWLASSVLKVPESQIRIVSPDMGGSFGLRATIFPEIPLVLWAARQLGRPVKWVNERSDGILEEQGRDFIMHGELALDRDGRFLGLRVDVVGNMGAYLLNYGPHPPLGNIGGVAGVYTTPAIHACVTSVFTNTGPTGPVRGAGRPEATSLIEQIIEKAAREMRIDRVELHRRNIIQPSAMPFQTPLTFNYDPDYPSVSVVRPRRHPREGGDPGGRATGGSFSGAQCICRTRTLEATRLDPRLVPRRGLRPRSARG